jgi:hypothetical protein
MDSACSAIFSVLRDSRLEHVQYSIIALDYKINFTAENSEGIPAIHERVATRLFDLVTSNGGLYIKIGRCWS